MYTPITGTGDGSAPVVNLTWPFLSQGHVKARVNGDAASVSFTGPAQITFDDPVAAGADYEVYRQTPITTAMVDYTNGAVLTENDLDLAQNQLLYFSQEIDYLGGNDAAQIDANSILGNNKGFAAQATPLDGAAVAALLPVVSLTAKGLVPVLSGDATQALRGDGIFGPAPVGPMGPPGDVAKVADRVAMAAIDLASILANPQMTRWLTEVGHEGMWTFDSSDLSAHVTVDTAGGLYVAPDADPTGASGAWVRHVVGHYNVTWFGAISGGSAAINGPAFTAALAAAADHYTTGYVGGYGKGTPAIFVPAGNYDLGDTTLDFTYTTIFEGVTSAMEGGMASVLKWNPGHTGIRVQAYNTSGDTDTGTYSYPGGSGTMIRRLALIGGFGVAGTEGEYHAIHARGRVTVEDVFGDLWQGDVLHLDTSVGGGNVNLTQAIRLQAQQSRNTVFTKGADSNAGYFEAISGIANRQTNIWEQSFLGNSYQMTHGAACARTNMNDGINIPVTFVHRTGHIYFTVLGQEAWASVNPPPGDGTSNQGWRHFGAGGIDALTGVPDWFDGILVRAGGSIVQDGLANASTFTAPYGEIDTVETYDQRALVINHSGDAVRVKVTGGVVGTDGTDGVRSITATYRGIDFDSPVNLNGSLNANNLYNRIGPAMGPVGDGVTILATRNAFAGIQAQTFDANGNPVAAPYGSLSFYNGLGSILDAANAAHWHRWRIAGTDIAHVEDAGLAIDATKALYHGANKVVGAQGAAVADASHAAAAPTKAEFDALVDTVNALLARLRAATGHGLIA